MSSREEQELINFEAEDNSDLMAAADWIEHRTPSSQPRGMQSSARPSHMDGSEVLTQEYRPPVPATGLSAFVNGSHCPGTPSQPAPSFPICPGEPLNAASAMGWAHFHHNGPHVPPLGSVPTPARASAARSVSNGSFHGPVGQDPSNGQSQAPPGSVHGFNGMPPPQIPHHSQPVSSATKVPEVRSGPGM